MKTDKILIYVLIGAAAIGAFLYFRKVSTGKAATAAETPGPPTIETIIGKVMNSSAPVPMVRETTIPETNPTAEQFTKNENPVFV